MGLGLRFSLVGWLLAFGWVPAEAAIFPLDLGRVGQRAGLLELARDQNFEQMLVSFPVGSGSRYLVNLPETAVYFVRIRQQNRIIWSEAVVALVDEPSAEHIPHLVWGETGGAMKYRIWLCRVEGDSRWMETRNLEAYLGQVGAPWLIRLRAIDRKGGGTPVTQLQMNWVKEPGRLAEKLNPTQDEPRITLDPSSPDDDQTVYEPEDGDLLTGEEGPMDKFMARTTPKVLPPLKRQHHIYAWVRYLQEQFVVDKRDRFSAAPSHGLGSGGAGQYYIKPNLSLQGAIDTHATHTIYDEGGSDAPAMDQKRIRAHLGLLLDLLNTNDREPLWSINLGPVLSYQQMPMERDQQAVTDFGLQLALQGYAPRFDVELLALKSGSREFEVRYIFAWTIGTLHPFGGFYRYDTRQTSGPVNAHFRESGVRLGIERDF